jgi:transposase InsO family protein/transposase-like protein
MAAKRKIYTAEFKREAVSLITHHGYGVSEAARNLGLHATLLRKWKRAVEQQGAQAFRQRSSASGSGRTPSAAARKSASADGTRYLEEGRPFFRQRGELRYAFIAEAYTSWPVSLLCEVMQVSRSGFYAYEQRQAHTTVDRDARGVLARIKAIAADTRHSYGSRRMAKQLQDEGFSVGRTKARRLMKEAGVTVRRPRSRGPVTTNSRHGYGVADNVLARQFDVAKPDQAWSGDITYIWTAEGWLYVAVLLDLYSRKVVGWAMSRHIDTAWVPQALQMALGRRMPAAGLVHHSDRGSQYASHAYRNMLEDHGSICSMSSQGDCLDNAVAERFFGSLKREWTSHCAYATRQEAKDDIIAYIEMFYNSRRRHSYLGYVSPNDYEKSALVA